MAAESVGADSAEQSVDLHFAPELPAVGQQLGDFSACAVAGSAELAEDLTRLAVCLN